MYQGRFKSFPIQADRHILVAGRYVERNALRARLVVRAEDWRWCSLWRRERGSDAARSILSDWPVERPVDWIEWINQPQTQMELEAVRASVARGRPLGNDQWQQETARQLGLQFTFRRRGPAPRGQPRIV